VVLGGKLEVSVVQGDITEQKVEGIVNAANGSLQHTGGIAGAIVKKGGV
jgi:O-acetyl-ADP-ribose deacetylase